MLHSRGKASRVSNPDGSLSKSRVRNLLANQGKLYHQRYCSNHLLLQIEPDLGLIKSSHTALHICGPRWREIWIFHEVLALMADLKNYITCKREKRMIKSNDCGRVLEFFYTLTQPRNTFSQHWFEANDPHFGEKGIQGLSSTPMQIV